MVGHKPKTHYRMSEQERIKDMMGTEMFNDTELEGIEGGFKSWAYYQIFHYTNEEWYYVDEERSTILESTADKEVHTEKGIIFCFS